MIRCAGWIIDLGPDGGDKGGEIVVVGTPETVEEHPVALRKDAAAAAIQAVITNLPELSSTSGGGGLIQTTSG